MAKMYHEKDADVALIRAKKSPSSATDPKVTPTPSA